MAKPNDLGHARLGLVVSKRLFPRAVDRNRMRRRIREAFRQQAAGLPSLDLVVRTQAVPPATLQEVLRQDLLNAFGLAAKKCCPAC